jgi:hypothetical protein
MLPLMEIGAGDGMEVGDGGMRIVLNISLSLSSLSHLYMERGRTD